MQETKRCARCQQELSRADFSTDRSRKDGLNKYCRPCHRQVRRDSYWKNPERSRQQSLSCHQAHPDIRRRANKRWVKRHWEEGGRERNYHYGIWYRHRLSKEALAAMSAAQEGKCALCHQVKRLCVDHSHITGKIRGLLCIRCNAALGQLVGDDPANVDRIREYLLRGI